jgi:hypothetical protein
MRKSTRRTEIRKRTKKKILLLLVLLFLLQILILLLLLLVILLVVPPFRLTHATLLVGAGSPVLFRPVLAA